jgi:hypothetical protein
MLKGEAHDRLVLALAPAPSEQEGKWPVADCVGVFLRAYYPARTRRSAARLR